MLLGQNILIPLRTYTCQIADLHMLKHGFTHATMFVTC
nr:MAG TPA: hypothetical protein [Inoviridae sp.]